MKRIVISFLIVYCLTGFSMTVFAAEAGKNSSDKSAGAAIAGDAKEVKKDMGKTAETTKDAIVRDAKAMKEEIPKGLKESKDAVIQQSKEVKEATTKELREIRDNMAHPTLKPRSDPK